MLEPCSQGSAAENRLPLTCCGLALPPGLFPEQSEVEVSLSVAGEEWTVADAWVREHLGDEGQLERIDMHWPLPAEAFPERTGVNLAHDRAASEPLGQSRVWWTRTFVTWVTNVSEM